MSNNPFQDWQTDVFRDQQQPTRAKLGYVVSGAFTIEVSGDQSVYWVRTDVSYGRLKHKGRVIAPPPPYNTKESQNIAVKIGYDEENEFCILGLWTAEARANLSHFGNALIIPSVEGGSGIEVVHGTLKDTINLDIAELPESTTPVPTITYLPATTPGGDVKIRMDHLMSGRYEPLMFMGELVTFRDDVIMIGIP